ncbi:MAG: hypothetical protein ACK5Q5_23520 [Planctomycetaceae bacterium]
MRKFQVHRTTGILAATLLAAWSVSVRADDAGVVRIANRSSTAVVRVSDRPVVRGQSPVDMTNFSVQQTSLSQLCPSSTDCTDVSSGGSIYYTDSSGQYCPEGEVWYECSECDCGHDCAVIDCLINSLTVLHKIKVDLLNSLGLPSHCCCLSRRIKAKRVRCKSYRSREARLAGERAHRQSSREQWVADRMDQRKERLAHSKWFYLFGTKNPPCGHYQIVYPVDPWYGDARDAGVYAAEGYGGPMSVPLAPVIRHTFNYGWGVPSSRLTPVSHLAAMPYGGYGPPAWNNGYYAPYYASAPQGQSPAAQTAGLPAPITR